MVTRDEYWCIQFDGGRQSPHRREWGGGNRLFIYLLGGKQRTGQNVVEEMRRGEDKSTMRAQNGWLVVHGRKWNKGMSRKWVKLTELWLVEYNDIIECNGIVENTRERDWVGVYEYNDIMENKTGKKEGLDKRKYSKGACRISGWAVVVLLCVTGVWLCCECWILNWGLGTWCITVTPLESWTPVPFST